MKQGRECNRDIQKKVLAGSKTPHSTSYPVIRFENGDYYLAVFVFLYSKKDIENGSVDRPTIWAIADIETGNIINEYQTQEKEFSDATYSEKYDIRSDGQYDTSIGYYEKAFKYLDDVRKEILINGRLDKEKYEKYLYMILANIPKEYKRFYVDLSVELGNKQGVGKYK